MSARNVTEALVEAIAKHSVENAAEPCPWDAVDPLVQFGIKEQVLRFLNTATPVMIEQGWTPPKENR